MAVYLLALISQKLLKVTLDEVPQTLEASNLGLVKYAKEQKRKIISQ